MARELHIPLPLPEFIDLWLDNPVVLYTKLFKEYPWEIFHPLERRYLQVLSNYIATRPDPSPPPESNATLWLDLGGVAPTEETPAQAPSRPRGGGRPPVPFLALLKAFLGARVQRCEDTAFAVWELLHNNPAFCYACGFSKAPSYRVVSRFDQIMTEEGLWDEFRRLGAQHNLDAGTAQLPSTLAVDTTHAEGDATLGKTCKDSDTPTDDNIGLVRKSATVTYVGHKLAVLSDPAQQLPWVIRAFPGHADDGHTLPPTVDQFLSEFPQARSPLRFLLADGIYNSQANHDYVRSLNDHPVRLLTPIHPRNRKDQPVKASGITHIDRYGVPHCIAGQALVFKGRDLPREHFVWVCPRLNPDLGTGEDCPLQYRCCPRAAMGRVFRVHRRLTPQIDWEYPQYSDRHRQLYAQRTSVERVIAWLKDRLGMRRVHKRGRAAAQSLGAQCAGLMHIFHYLRRTGILPQPQPRAA